jgi:hypothetical protein
MFELENQVPVFFEVRNMWTRPDVRAMPNYRGMQTAVIIDYEGGSFRGGRGGGWVYDRNDKKIKQFVGDGGGRHHANFIDAVRQRNKKLLRSPIETNHRSDSWHHLANISQRLGQHLSPETLKTQLSNNPDAIDGLMRYSKQMSNWNIDFTQEPWTLGASLTFDAQTERFTGPLSETANQLLHRRDRPPFIVPEKV